jgi:hypothetical protein
VALHPQPEVLQGELKPEIARAVMAWSTQNTAALVAYRDGELDTIELGARLQRYAG